LPTTQSIANQKQFETWLHKIGWLQDGCLRNLRTQPASAEQNRKDYPQLITLQLSMQTNNAYLANKVRISKCYEIDAKNIRKYELLHPGHIKNHCSEGFDLVESDTPISFRLDVPGRLEIHCSRLEIRELPALHEKIEPAPSDLEISAIIHDHEMPTPNQWQKLFAKQDLQVAWHMYGGGFRATASVPRTQYDGWYLQQEGRLTKTNQGLFFLTCKQTDDGFKLVITNANASKALWGRLLEVLSEFPTSEIRSGNCLFSQNSLKRYIKIGESVLAEL